MTEARANEILRTKYPEATIFNGRRFGGANSNEMVVTFQDGGKCYKYGALTYQQVLIKLGFNILYRHNVLALETEISWLEKAIADGGVWNEFHLFSDEDWIPYTETELAEMARKLEHNKATLKNAIIE